jgi:hypothetical protein
MPHLVRSGGQNKEIRLLVYAGEGELVSGSTGGKKKHNASVCNFGGF